MTESGKRSIYGQVTWSGWQEQWAVPDICQPTTWTPADQATLSETPLRLSLPAPTALPASYASPAQRPSAIRWSCGPLSAPVWRTEPVSKHHILSLCTKNPHIRDLHGKSNMFPHPPLSWKKFITLAVPHTHPHGFLPHSTHTRRHQFLPAPSTSIQFVPHLHLHSLHTISFHSRTHTLSPAHNVTVKKAKQPGYCNCNCSSVISKLLTVQYCVIAQFTITINSNVCPHIRVLNTLMRESYAWRHRNMLFPEHIRQLYRMNYGYF